MSIFCMAWIALMLCGAVIVWPVARYCLNRLLGADKVPTLAEFVRAKEGRR